MENYKIKVGLEAESKEAQGFLFDLGYVWLSGDNGKFHHLKSPYLYTSKDMGLWCDDYHATFNESGNKEISIDQLKDMVVLKRNDVSDATHTDGHYSFYVGKDKNYFFSSCDKAWRGTWKNVEILKPIEKPMKEYLVKNQHDEYVFLNDVSCVPSEFVIEVPEGADTLAGDERTHYFWKHGVGEKGNMIIGVGESLTRYSGWTDCKDSADMWLDCVNDDSFKIIWQRETLNDKVASAEVARQEFIGAPFSDLPEFNFEAVGDFVESNVEQTLSDRESTYGSFKDEAVTTRNLMNCIDVDSMSAVQQEALHMICSKLARIANGDPNHVDSWHNIAGYASLVVKDINGNP